MRRAIARRPSPSAFQSFASPSQAMSRTCTVAGTDRRRPLGAGEPDRPGGQRVRGPWATPLRARKPNFVKLIARGRPFLPRRGGVTGALFRAGLGEIPPAPARRASAGQGRFPGVGASIRGGRQLPNAKEVGLWGRRRSGRRTRLALVRNCVSNAKCGGERLCGKYS